MVEGGVKKTLMEIRSTDIQRIRACKIWSLDWSFKKETKLKLQITNQEIYQALKKKLKLNRAKTKATSKKNFIIGFNFPVIWQNQ